jgi:hypothetical protein
MPAELQMTYALDPVTFSGRRSISQLCVPTPSPAKLRHRLRSRPCREFVDTTTPKG